MSSLLKSPLPPLRICPRFRTNFDQFGDDSSLEEGKKNLRKKSKLNSDHYSLRNREKHKFAGGLVCVCKGSLSSPAPSWSRGLGGQYLTSCGSDQCTSAPACEFVFAMAKAVVVQF